MRWLLTLLIALPLAASAQQNQCRTSPVGASTSYCASEAFVTETAAAGVSLGAPVVGGTPGDILAVGSGPSLIQFSPTPVANSLAADVAMNNTSNYFTGPQVAQGSTGNWFASGTVTVSDTAGAANIYCKLWDGTTVIASGNSRTNVVSDPKALALSGALAAPAGNIRISCRDITSTSGVILSNVTGNAKDSTITVFRIQ